MLPCLETAGRAPRAFCVRVALESMLCFRVPSNLWERSLPSNLWERFAALCHPLAWEVCGAPLVVSLNSRRRRIGRSLGERRVFRCVCSQLSSLQKRSYKPAERAQRASRAFDVRARAATALA